jgi:hypothetical protein
LRSFELQDQQEQECENARLRVQASQYEVDRAFEQFDAVDPKNRLVADTLEGRLNEKLQQLEEAKRHLEGHEVRRTALDEDQRRKLEALAEDFPSLWNHPEANATLKKRILRTVLEEVIVTHDVERSELDVVLHWKGSVHTRVRVAKKPTLRGNKADPSLVDAEIARILNMKKMRSPRGLLWTQSRVQDFRRYQRIHSPNKACEGQFLTGQQAMESLGVSRNALFALLRRGAIHNGQVTDFAPWRIDRNELESDEVQELVAFMKKHGRFPKGGSPRNQPGLFDANKGLTPEV